MIYTGLCRRCKLDGREIELEINRCPRCFELRRKGELMDTIREKIYSTLTEGNPGLGISLIRAVDEIVILGLELEKLKADYAEEVRQFNLGHDAFVAGEPDEPPSFDNDHDVWRCGWAWAQYDNGITVMGQLASLKAHIADANENAVQIAERVLTAARQLQTVWGLEAAATELITFVLNREAILPDYHKIVQDNDELTARQEQDAAKIAGLEKALDTRQAVYDKLLEDYLRLKKRQSVGWLARLFFGQPKQEDDAVTSCEWMLLYSYEAGVWKSGCGKQIILSDEMPASGYFRYCPVCGKRIEVMKP